MLDDKGHVDYMHFFNDDGTIKNIQDVKRFYEGIFDKILKCAFTIPLQHAHMACNALT